jgi:hypothetical protein
MKRTLGQRIGQVVAVGVLGSVLLLVLVAAGTVAVGRQRRAVPGARSAPASAAVNSQEATSAAPSNLPSSQAALQPPVRPVPAQAQIIILVASPEQATAVTQQLAQARSLVPSLQAEVLVVSPTESAALAAMLQQRVLVEGHPLGPVIDLRPPQ